MYLPYSSVEDAQSAARFAEASVAYIGVAYHPDTRFSDYIDETGRRLFTQDESARLDFLAEKAFSFCGTALYDIAVARQRQHLGLV
jgi:hypothetical protein